MFNSLKHKLFGTYLIGVLCVAVLALAAFVQKYNSIQSFIVSKNQLSDTYAEVVLMRVELARGIQEWKNVLIRSHDPELLSKYWSASNDNFVSIGKRLNSLNSERLNQPARKLLDNFNNQLTPLQETYTAQYKKLVQQEASIKALDLEIISIDRT